jgi:hypothetical protein
MTDRHQKGIKILFDQFNLIIIKEMTINFIIIIFFVDRS